ncbi:helix-turn-helix domain-containing protein [Aureitalea sp. L0-47]|uniref:helix-turn-helix domain-containing protein n=1 Tax=Aureitalea sp. L0-47 TaxID=2816962 RepID=UPI0022377138|nr:helix-turn-helix domain-containing protein [Aureitalea sp. L0-47]MCW5519444.1 helix-turn-helix domain-containing protein [Aureitalea sp. L0-47]
MGRRNPFIEDLRAIVLNNYTDEQFGVSELVEICGKSRSQLHRKVKSASGKSLSQFIREIRLDEAKKLLFTEDITASEVAYQVGFNSPTYFNTCFNEYFGYPPGEVKHRAELDEPSVDSSLEVPKRSGKIRRVLVWLIIVTVIVVSAIAFNYLDPTSNFASEELPDKSKTIAVLPFKNWSGDPELEYVSDGMTDAVITRLAGISDIDRVVPYSTVVNYKNSEKTTNTIAKELDVEFILEGNFKLSGNRVMSNLNLIEAASEKYLWTLEYKGAWRTDEIFEMQAAIAENVAENMEVDISSNERKTLEIVPTSSAEAYKLYLNAQYNYETLSPLGFSAAERLFKSAIEQDSLFIEPYLGLASNYFVSGLVWGGISQEEAKTKGNKYLQLAEKISAGKEYDYEDSLLIVRMFGSFYYNWDFQFLYNNFQQIEGKAKNNLSSMEIGGLIEFHRKMGNFDKAIEYGLLGIDLNQVGSGTIAGLAFANYLKGNKEKALEILDKNEALFSNEFFYLMESSKIYYYIEDHEKSKQQLDKLLARFPDYPPIITWLRAMHAQIEGDYQEVEQHLSRLKKNYQENTSGSPAWFIALYYCEIGEFDTSFYWLNKSFEHREVELTWLKEEPLLNPLKEDPRYLELYNKIGFNVISPLVE